MIPIHVDFCLFCVFVAFYFIFCLFLRLFDYLRACFLAWLTVCLYFCWFVYSLIIMMVVPFLVIMCPVNHLNNQSNQTAVLLRIWSLFR